MVGRDRTDHLHCLWCVFMGFTTIFGLFWHQKAICKSVCTSIQYKVCDRSIPKSAQVFGPSWSLKWILYSHPPVRYLVANSPGVALASVWHERLIVNLTIYHSIPSRVLGSLLSNHFHSQKFWLDMSKTRSLNDLMMIVRDFEKSVWTHSLGITQGEPKEWLETRSKSENPQNSLFWICSVCFWCHKCSRRVPKWT